MDTKKAIEQLESLKRHCNSMVDPTDSDEIWQNDVAALDHAIEKLEGLINERKCENCKNGVDYGDSVEYIYCEKTSKRKSVKKNDSCEKFEK